MAQLSLPGVVLDGSTGRPFSDAPEMPGSYAATTILVQPDGGRVELTEHNAELRHMAYVDVWASQSPIGAVVGKMVRRLSMLPRKVYQHAPGNRVTSLPAVGTKPPRTRRALPEEIEDPTNSLCSLLWEPAPGYGAMSLSEWQYLSAIVNGGSLLAKFREDGPGTPPTMLIPLDWRFLQAWARIGQPVIVWATVQTGELKWLMPSEALFTSWATVSGANGAWLCTSPLQQLGLTIKVDEAAARHAAAYFRNGARPSFIVTIPPGVDTRQAPQVIDRVQNQIQQSHGGVDNAFRTIVLGGGATGLAIGNSPGEAQLVETRAQDFREVCAVLDMPFDDMFGDGSSTPEGEARVWKALMPWAKMGDDRFNAQVVRPEPEWRDQRYFVKTDFNEALYGDLLVLSDKMCQEVTIGLRTVNEGRVPLGLPPRDDPAADELIYRVPGAGLVGDLPGQLSVAEEEREMVMPPPGEEQPLEAVNAKLGAEAGGA